MTIDTRILLALASVAVCTAPAPLSVYAEVPEATIGYAVQEIPDLTELLDILTATPEGDWVQVSLNGFSEAWTPAELRPLQNYANPTPSKLIKAWGSFAWDSRRGDLLIYGGGHANYSGNDVYRWRGRTLRWERASLPSQISQDGLGNFIAIDGVDNAPASAHTYDNNIYLPAIDRFVTFGGAAYNNGGAYLRQIDEFTAMPTGPYFFDPARANPDQVGGSTGSHVQREQPFPEITGGQMWENRDVYANIPGEPELPGNFVVGATGRLLEDGKDVVLVSARPGLSSSQYLYRYTVNDISDPSLDTWELVGTFWNGLSGQGAGAYDPVLNIFVRTGNGKFGYWDLATPGPQNPDILFVPEEPSGEFLLTTDHGLDYDPARDQYALWEGGAEVWMLRSPGKVSPQHWTLEKQPEPGSPVPDGSVETGILGRWKYIPNLDAFIGLQDAELGNVWVYKPLGWQSPATTPNPPGRAQRGAPSGID